MFEMEAVAPAESRSFQRAADLVTPPAAGPTSLFAPPADAETQRRQHLQAVLIDVLRAADADRAIAETAASTVWPRLERTAQQLGDTGLADIVRILGLSATLERLAAAYRYQSQIQALAAKELETVGITPPGDPVPTGFQKALEGLQAAVAQRVQLPGSAAGYGGR
jgi:hypothetical protein